MIVRRFLSWARIAPACARADATSALARAYLFANMDEAERYEAEIALTVMLDDPSPLVHRALAEAIASAAEAPRHLLTGLVAQGGEAAALVLGRTRLLSEAELVDAAALGAEKAQIAIARRDALPATVAAALAEIGSLAACTALVRNPSAIVAEAALLRMLERFGTEASLREALLARPDLPARLRERLMAMVSDVLKSFVVERGWLSAERAERLARDAEHRGALTLACDERLDLGDVVACLKEGGRLTPAFVVHALLAGQLDLVAASLADLGDTPPAKVAAFLREDRQAPLRAVLKRAGIPDWLAPVFPIALVELRAAAIAGAGATASTPLRVALRRILAQLAGRAERETGRLIAYLRTLEAETARGEARALAEAMIALDEEALATEPHDLALAANAVPKHELELQPLDTLPVAVDLDAIAVARAA
ncbi:Uncharacterized conserved protein, DUF2336 family [Rhizobiales bacterium GAS188]|nr:Uncharacterized conserved protein, DUF2336 family [Rhizobiales bacterium GAS188]